MLASLESVLIVGGGVAAAIIGAISVRRKFHNKELTKHHEVAGYLLGVVSTLYGVLLGLIVVSAQAKYDQARITAETEANCCSDIGNFTRGLPEEARDSIRGPLKEYYTIVQSEDWEAIAMGEKEQSIPPYQAMWKAIGNYQPQGNRENACYQSILSTMKELSDARRFRMSARKRALSPIVWTVLVTGAIMTILFTYFFWVESQTMQLVLTVFISLFISLNLLVVRLFDNPYRHELLVKEGAFILKPSVFNGGKEPSEKREGANKESGDKEQSSGKAQAGSRSDKPGENEKHNFPDPLVK